MCLINLWVNFHLQDNKTNGEHHEENQEGNDEWNEITDAINDHLHQEAVILEDFDEEKKLKEAGCHEHQLELWHKDNCTFITGELDDAQSAECKEVEEINQTSFLEVHQWTFVSKMDQFDTKQNDSWDCRNEKHGIIA